jgi:hypothetical protein
VRAFVQDKKKAAKLVKHQDGDKADGVGAGGGSGSESSDEGQPELD